MIGKIRTTHPTEGYTVIVTYNKTAGSVRITSITDVNGNDIWGKMSSKVIQAFKSEIAE